MSTVKEAGKEGLQEGVVKEEAGKEEVKAPVDEVMKKPAKKAAIEGC